MEIEIWYLAYKPLLYKYLGLLYRPSIDFEDFKQEGELALWELLKKYDPSCGNLSAYLKKSLYYALIRARDKLTLKEESLEDIEYENLEKEVYSEEKREIDFSSLSPREKEILMLLFYSNLSEREAASFLKISRSSIRVYKKRAVEKLKF